MDFEPPRIVVGGVRASDELPEPFPPELDGLAFVGWTRSPRSIDPRAAARVIAEVPAHVVPLAVMAAPLPEVAERWLEESRCRALVLRGDDTPEAWIGFPHPLLRRIEIDDEAREEFDAWEGIARAYVLVLPRASNGVRHADDLALARELALRAKCLLAGSIEIDEIVELARTVRPHGFAASSRLEDARGRKDGQLVRTFVERAHAALQRSGAARA